MFRDDDTQASLLIFTVKLYNSIFVFFCILAQDSMDVQDQELADFIKKRKQYKTHFNKVKLPPPVRRKISLMENSASTSSKVDFNQSSSQKSRSSQGTASNTASSSSFSTSSNKLKQRAGSSSSSSKENQRSRANRSDDEDEDEDDDDGEEEEEE